MSTSPIQIIWIYPDRGGRQLYDLEEKFWQEYRRVGADMGLEVLFVPPEAIDITSDGKGGSTAFIGSKKLARDKSIFVSDAYVFPYQSIDAWLLLSTFKTLELAGYFLTVSTDAAIWSNDKLSTMLKICDETLARTRIKAIPTVRLTAGRSSHGRSLPQLLAGYKFPLVVKPANWGSGMGINLVHDLAQLEGLMGIAQGTNTVLVIQPKIGSGKVADVRVYLAGGKAIAIMTRRPADGAIVANASAGGSIVFEEPRSPEIVTAAEIIAGRFDAPYICVDFLDDGKDYWLSEIEFDGASPVWLGQPGVEILQKRFEAYVKKAAQLRKS